MCNIWKDASFNGFPVVTESLSCDSTRHPYSDLDKVFVLFNCSLKKIEADPELSKLTEESRVLFKHLNHRRRYMDVFVRCEDVDCALCITHVVRAPRALHFIRNADITPHPMTSDAFHFRTFLESP